MGTVTKKALVDRIAERTGQKRIVVKKTVQEFLDLIIDELAEGNRLEFRDFGVFEVKERAPRMAQNPRTLERVPVPAKRTVKFKVGRKMQDELDAVTPGLNAQDQAQAHDQTQDHADALEAPTDQTPVAAPAEVHVNADAAAAALGEHHTHQS